METNKKLTAEIVLQMIAASDKLLTEKFQETDKRFQETDRRFQETDKLLTEKFQETDRRFQETDKLLTKKFQETSTMINQLRGHFDKQFGKLLEALIQKNTINLFIDKGIKITHSKPNPETVYKGKNMEFDLLLQNDTEIVVIEAKVSLNKQKVYHFAKKIENFKLFFKEFKNYKVYPALASITSKSDAHELASQKGYYILKLKNEEFMEFNNTPDFIPIAY